MSAKSNFLFLKNILFWNNYVASKEVYKEMYMEVPCTPSSSSLHLTQLQLSFDCVFEIERRQHVNYIKSSYKNNPDQVVQWIRASSCTPKGGRFNSQLGHIRRLQVPSLVGVCTGGNWSMFLSPHAFLSL